MHDYLFDCLALLLRWAHVITAMAWVGASFHFIALDASLTPPSDWRERDRGIGGEHWLVRDGSFFHVQNYPVAPPILPARLHASAWESHGTWLTGFALFTILYLYQAGTLLVDPNRLDWPASVAGATAIGLLAAFWLIYEGLCRAIGQRRHAERFIAVSVGILTVAAAWLCSHLFPSRAACLLVGAMLATAMSANVAFQIVPGQRRAVAALRAGEAVNPLEGQRGRQRSLHNTFFTLPVLLAMLSHHFAALHQSTVSWLWLLLLMLAGALIRLAFLQRHQAQAAGRPVSWRPALAGAALIGGVAVGLASWSVRDASAPGRMAELDRDLRNGIDVGNARGGFGIQGNGPPPVPVAAALPPVTLADMQRLMDQHCVMCHNESLSSNSLVLTKPEQIERNAQTIYRQVVCCSPCPSTTSQG